VAVPLPRTTLASYLVLGRAPVADPDIVVWSNAGQLASTSAQALAAHVGDLRILSLGDLADAPVPPEELLRATASSAAARELVEAATLGWALLLRLRPGAVVAGDVALRAAARLLATHADGVVVDTALPRAFVPAGDFRDPPATSDLLTFTHEPVGAEWTVSTRGLARFGLSELTASGLSAELLPAGDALLVGLAHRVVQALGRIDHEDPAMLRLPSPLRLGLEDVAAGYAQPIGDDPSAARSVPVMLSVSAGTIVVSAATEAARGLFGDVLPR